VSHRGRDQLSHPRPAAKALPSIRAQQAALLEPTGRREPKQGILNQRPVGDLGNKGIKSTARGGEVGNEDQTAPRAHPNHCCNVSNKRRDPASSSLITQEPVQCASNSMPSSRLVTDQFEKPFATAQIVQVAPMTRRFGQASGGVCRVRRSR
jgi:hypothetical protein